MVAQLRPNVRDVERAVAGEELALGLRTVGWTLLLFDWLIIVYIFVDLRAGSTLWLRWTSTQAVAGAALVLAGRWMESRMAKEVSPLRAPEHRLQSEEEDRSTRQGQDQAAPPGDRYTA